MRFAGTLVHELAKRGLTITTVESCTGGALVNALTSIEGSSEVIRGAFVTYSNEAKLKLGVPAAIIEEFGVYSPACAEAMAKAGLERSVGADVCIAVTGSLGRIDPANADSQVGEAHICVVYQMRRDIRLPHDEVLSTTVQVPSADRGSAKRDIGECAFKFAIALVTGGVYDSLS